jgi:hypothetical protein
MAAERPSNRCQDVCKIRFITLWCWIVNNRGAFTFGYILRSALVLQTIRTGESVVLSQVNFKFHLFALNTSISTALFVQILFQTFQKTLTPSYFIPYVVCKVLPLSTNHGLHATAFTFSITLGNVLNFSQDVVLEVLLVPSFRIGIIPWLSIVCIPKRNTNWFTQYIEV